MAQASLILRHLRLKTPNSITDSRTFGKPSQSEENQNRCQKGATKMQETEPDFTIRHPLRLRGPHASFDALGS
jgi:hypothetical protein